MSNVPVDYQNFNQKLYATGLFLHTTQHFWPPRPSGWIRILRRRKKHKNKDKQQQNKIVDNEHFPVSPSRKCCKASYSTCSLCSVIACSIWLNLSLGCICCTSTSIQPVLSAVTSSINTSSFIALAATHIHAPTIPLSCFYTCCGTPMVWIVSCILLHIYFSYIILHISLLFWNNFTLKMPPVQYCTII